MRNRHTGLVCRGLHDLKKEIRTKKLKILPLSNLTKNDLAKGMCTLGYRFFGVISHIYYNECSGKFREMSCDINWFDDEEFYDLYIGVSIVYDIDGEIVKDHYGLWGKKELAAISNLGWIEECCGKFGQKEVKK